MKLFKGMVCYLVCMACLGGCIHPSAMANTRLTQYSTGGDLNQSQTEFTSISTPAQTKTKTPIQTETTTTSQTPRLTLPATNTPTAWPLTNYSSFKIRSGVEPVTYIMDTCAYLQARWDETKSEPGTIVVPIMFHSITQPGKNAEGNTTITYEYFEALLQHAKNMGYETITVEELIAFLTTNAIIPSKSMIMILDDRRPGVTELFMPHLLENDWTLTLGWISSRNSESIWSRMEKLHASGHLDVQSHGYYHIYVQPYLSDSEIQEDIVKPIDILAEHFGKKPDAYIWPGGNFSQLAVDFAREAGYSLGFTAYSRGPLMFNWVPLGPKEREINDPLMVLPRFWSTTAISALEEGVRVQEEASFAAKAARNEELLWMQLFCQFQH